MRALTPWRWGAKPAKGKNARSRGGGRRRRRSLDRRQRRLLALATVTMLAGAGASAGSWWLWQSGWVGATLTAAELGLHRQLVAAGLKIEDIFVSGRNETGKEQLLSTLGARRGQSILAFDPAAARARLLRLGWVKDARVVRRLPGTVLVFLEERRPLALWQHDGRHLLIDRDGAPISRQDLGRFATLPLVIGPDAPEHAAELIDLMAQEPVLFSQVEAVVRVGARRWNLRMAHGIDVQLPEGDPAAAWQRLIRLSKEHDIFSRDIVAIDLRLPDRLVVRLTPEAAARGKNGKDT